jgi:dihydroorotase
MPAQNAGMTAESPPTSFTMPLADDFHIHLRKGELMETVVPLVKAGGVGRCLVMPNTVPPILSADDASRYRDELMSVSDDVEYLPVISLSSKLTSSEIDRAAGAGIVGVKCFPRGVTTNSVDGVSDFDAFDTVLTAMQERGMTLEIHGELPAETGPHVTVMNAEQLFLEKLGRMHSKFPDLRIVLEHVSSVEAVEAVKSLGANVAATVTPHHLELTVDDWTGRNHNLCKPVAKLPRDRDAICDVVREGHPRFFLGSDSAPHYRRDKECACAKPGVFTTPLLLSYLADRFDRLGCLDRLPDFAAKFGREFYGLPANEGTVTLERREQLVPDSYGPIVPYRSGETLHWRLQGA